MPVVDLIDETFLVADPAAVAEAIHQPALWRAWWPDLDLVVFQDRGGQGLRWTVTGALAGTAEIWLEPWGDGVILHCFLRADPTRPRRGGGSPAAVARLAVRETRRRAGQIKRAVNALKDQLEAGRPPAVGRSEPG
ncbi:MAG: polyketide cyclase / dehydrase and lipid transport [Mycobacteriales bacterium]